MSKTYTEIFAEKIDERYSPMTVSHHATNNDYSFEGAQTVKVTSINTVGLSSYNRTTGYGSTNELSNTIQSLVMSQDKCFKILLDKMDEDEMKIKAGEVLGRQMREVVNPELEKYRFDKMLKCVNTTTTNKITAKSTGSAYECFLKAQEKLDDAFVPAEGRIAYVTPEYFNALKLDGGFIKASDLGQNILMKGQVGTIDGVPVIKVNKAWMTDGSNPYGLLIAHKGSTVAPVKLAEYRTVTDSENYSGTLFMARIYHDCFVLENKKLGLAGVVMPLPAPKKAE